MSEIKQILHITKKNFYYILSAEVLIRFLTFLLTVYIAQSYGPKGFGIYALALVVAGLLDIIFQMGISLVYVQRVAANKEETLKQIRIFLPLKIILSLLTLISSFLVVVLLNKNEDVSMAIILGTVYISINSICTFLWSIFDARLEMKYSAFFKIFEFAILFISGSLMIYFAQPIQYIFYAYILAVIVTTITTYLVINHKISGIHFNFDFKEWRKIISEGWPITAAGAFILVYNYLDTIIISIMRGEELVGIYQAPYKITGTLFIISALINQAYFPSLIITKAQDEKHLSHVFEKAVQYMLFWSLPITFGAFLLSDKIILFVFGDKYIGSIPVFNILIWTCILYFLSSALVSLLFALKQQKKTVKIFFLGALLNTVSNIYIIPLYGIVGAAGTTIITEIIVLIGIYILARKSLKFKILKHIVNPAIATFAMSIIVSFINLESLALTITIGATTYFGTYFIISYVSNIIKTKPQKI